MRVQEYQTLLFLVLINCLNYKNDVFLNLNMIWCYFNIHSLILLKLGQLLCDSLLYKIEILSRYFWAETKNVESFVLKFQKVIKFFQQLSDIFKGFHLEFKHKWTKILIDHWIILWSVANEHLVTIGHLRGLLLLYDIMLNNLID